MSNRGDILRLKSWKTYGSNGKSWSGYNAHPGRVLVACVLGSEPLVMRDDAETLDTDRALNEMGWVLESVADKTCTDLEETITTQAAELQALRAQVATLQAVTTKLAARCRPYYPDEVALATKVLASTPDDLLRSIHELMATVTQALGKDGKVAPLALAMNEATRLFGPGGDR